LKKKERQLFVEMTNKRPGMQKKRVVVLHLVLRSGEVENFECSGMISINAHTEIQFLHPPLNTTFVSFLLSFFLIHHYLLPFFCSFFYFVLF
jgi:hypothetical protein